MFAVKIPKNLCDGDKKFCEYILAKLISRTTSSIYGTDYSYMDKSINEYINEEGSRYNSVTIISYYVRTFTIIQDNDYFYVGDNNQTELVSRDSGVTLNSVVRLIEYGAGDIPPIPRLSTVVNDLNSRISEEYAKWRSVNRR